MMAMDLATDYDKIFKNRLVVITGVARSGTTIVGKIIGSFENAHYLFEPSIFYLIPPLIKEKQLSKKEGGNLLKSVLFEDFYLQMMSGRYVNFNKKDDSYIGEYVDIKDVEDRWYKFERKVDLMDYLEKNDYLFVLKMPDIQPFYDLLAELFPSIKFIELFRDGNGVISSSIRRDFYSISDLNERLVMWSYMTNKLRVPWFIDEKNRDIFSKWNHQTRVAHIWRVQTEYGLKFASKSKNILRYNLDDFGKKPEDFVKKAEKFLDRKRTDITNKNIRSVETFKQRKYSDNTSDVASPEKEKFIELRKKLGFI
jgi:hypothetical protein